MRIGSYTVDGMTGDVPGYHARVETRERAGCDGYTFIQLGKRSKQFELKTRVGCSSLANARSTAQNYEQQCGKFVSVVDASGRTYTRVLVLDVSARAFPVLLATDGSSAMLEATWQLQRGG